MTTPSAASTAELLPCAHCGGDAKLWPNDCEISCNHCGIQTAYHESADNAVRVWNRRIAPKDSAYKQAISEWREEYLKSYDFAGAASLAWIERRVAEIAKGKTDV